MLWKQTNQERWAVLGSLCDSTHIKVLALKAFANLELEQTAISCLDDPYRQKNPVVKRKLQLQNVWF